MSKRRSRRPDRAGLRRDWVSRIDPVLVALTLLAFAVASYRLGAKSLWLDEVVSAKHAGGSVRSLVGAIVGGDPNGGLYYALLGVWVRMFGEGEIALRSLTVLLGGLGVPAMVLLGRRLFGRLTGLAAGLLLAVSPFFVHYEQTARSYALVVLLVTLSSYFFVVELEQPSRATRAGYVVTSALAIYAHYFAAWVLFVQLITLMVVKWRATFTISRQWLTAWAAIAGLCAPEAVFAARMGTGAISWIRPPTLHSLSHLPTQLAGGSLVLSTVLLALACYGFVRALADRRGWRAAFVAAWFVAPVLLDFALSELGRPLFISYYLIVVLPALLLLAGAGLAWLPGRGSRILALVLLLVLSGLGLARWYRQPSQEDYRAATRYLLGHEHPGDGVIYYPRYAADGITYYESRDHARGPAAVRFRVSQAVASRMERIWLVMRSGDVSAERRSQIEQAIGRAYARVPIDASFDGVAVVLYRARRASQFSGSKRALRTSARAATTCDRRSYASAGAGSRSSAPPG
jgi:4-amino-4-deoxy-L-arabinose transferase-like glycosyltransferase